MLNLLDLMPDLFLKGVEDRIKEKIKEVEEIANKLGKDISDLKLTQQELQKNIETVNILIKKADIISKISLGVTVTAAILTVLSFIPR